MTDAGIGHAAAVDSDAAGTAGARLAAAGPDWSR